MKKMWLMLALMVGGYGQAETLPEANEKLFEQLRQAHQLTPEQLAKVKEIFKKSGYMGQGNPKVATHPLTPEQCLDQAKIKQALQGNSEFEKICGGKWMAPLYDPSKETAADAKACIDQFEFPDIPCTYPVVWVRAKEAAEICEAMGKRMCDAHEWEGACAGALEEPDYPFEAGGAVGPNDKIRAMRKAHNAKYDKQKVWAYGPAPKKGVCAMNSFKNDGCNGGNWEKCGSNTYPTGSFLDCKSKLDVYDIHGNAAEHMNLPIKADQMASKGSKELGYTEMKGSWFIWDKYAAHPDQCRWRAPFWHGTRVMDKDSHENYHLGFRCCKTVK